MPPYMCACMSVWLWINYHINYMAQAAATHTHTVQSAVLPVLLSETGRERALLDELERLHQHIMSRESLLALQLLLL